MPAQVDPATRGRSREWLLVELAAAPPGTVEHVPRLRTVGLTGVRFGGVEFHGLRLAPDSILDGEREEDCSGEDRAAGTSATVLRTVLPTIALAGLDTALRLTFHHLRSRRLYGAAASDLPAIRSLLARTFVDLIACDCLAMTAARMISRLPAQAELYSLASLCLAAGVVPAAMHRLSVGLGARFYVRDGSSGMFQKLLRDLKPLGLGGTEIAAARLALVGKTSSSRGEPSRTGTVEDELAHAAAEPALRELTTLFERLKRDRCAADGTAGGSVRRRGVCQDLVASPRHRWLPRRVRRGCRVRSRRCSSPAGAGTRRSRRTWRRRSTPSSPVDASTGAV